MTQAPAGADAAVAPVGEDLHRQIFAEVDTDGSGAIDATELQQAMARFGHGLSMAEAQAMLEEADDSGDGVVDFDEFSAILAKQKDKVEWSELRGSAVVFGGDGVARSVSVNAELHVTMKRLQEA